MTTGRKRTIGLAVHCVCLDGPRLLPCAQIHVRGEGGGGYIPREEVVRASTPPVVPLWLSLFLSSSISAGADVVIVIVIVILVVAR